MTLASAETYNSLWHFLIVYCEVSSDGYEWKDFQHQLNIQFITLFQCKNEIYSNKIYAFQCHDIFWFKNTETLENHTYFSQSSYLDFNTCQMIAKRTVPCNCSNSMFILALLCLQHLNWKLLEVMVVKLGSFIC